MTARIVKSHVFVCCEALVDAEFGNKMEIIEHSSFLGCTSLERITIPLRDGLFDEGDTFRECFALKHVDLAEGEVHETTAALQFEEWSNDMNREIDSINRILPNAHAGKYYDVDGNEDYDYVEKAREMRRWIRSVIVKIIGYKTEHQRVLDGAATRLKLVLPRDIV